MSGAVAAVNGPHRPVAGQLLVRWERRPDTSILWLSGALDRATATLLDRELNARPLAANCLLVDLAGLELIDPRGINSLVRINQRAFERGDRLFFRHGPHVARSVLSALSSYVLSGRRVGRT